MLDFAAIDFETANAKRTSVCSVGIIVLRGGEIVHRYYSLIRPEPDYYNYHNTRVHGLTAADTEPARSATGPASRRSPTRGRPPGAGG